MKIREIILEAPQQMPNFGTAGQSYNVNYNLGGPAAAANTAAKGTDATKGTAAKTPPKVDLKTRPTDILSKISPNKVEKAKSIAAKSWDEVKTTKVYRWFGPKLLAPLVIWLDDMSAINVMWEEGHFNNHGNKAGEVAQQMRTAHTQLLFSRMATGYLAWFAVAKTTGVAARALMFLIPGLGWLAGTASFIAQTAMFVLLQSDAVQKFITLKIIENIPHVNDLTHSAAKVVAGGVGVWVPEYINRLKKKYTGAAADAATSLPEPVKSAASSVGDTAKGVANRIDPPTAEPTISKADLLKGF